MFLICSESLPFSQTFSQNLPANSGGSRLTGMNCSSTFDFRFFGTPCGTVGKHAVDPFAAGRHGGRTGMVGPPGTF